MMVVMGWEIKVCGKRVREVVWVYTRRRKREWVCGGKENGCGYEVCDKRRRFYGSVGGWSFDEKAVMVVKDGLEFISESKKVELKQKWEQLRVDKIEHYLTKLDLIREQIMLVIEAMKSYDGMMPDYIFKHHKTPSFHEFVKESLSFAGAMQTQLYEKVRKLREKYEKNARGENPEAFAKPHEGKVFELSKKI
ncbi:hypothetical protein Vadar_005123 [Vaccinium darrowii]|uniref:Uncharacterized protein n=1 Tax=Vaccinium darrowii TaxID=229202 RepID=A0ACB7XYG5_9ERIC|nr:hypothetical protein Vadar_005123 [Vaccinium darrowii]